MFLVQSKTSDGRLFYSYITGHEARLAKNWVSVQGGPTPKEAKLDRARRNTAA